MHIKCGCAALQCSGEADSLSGLSFHVLSSHCAVVALMDSDPDERGSAGVKTEWSAHLSSSPELLCLISFALKNNQILELRGFPSVFWFALQC